MKTLAVFVALTALLLSSCATLPKAERETDSLVVGSFVMDYLVEETGAHSSTWDFDRSLRRDDRQSEVPDYLQRVDPNTSWLSVDLRTP